MDGQVGLSLASEPRLVPGHLHTCCESCLLRSRFCSKSRSFKSNGVLLALHSHDMCALTTFVHCSCDKWRSCRTLAVGQNDTSIIFFAPRHSLALRVRRVAQPS